MLASCSILTAPELPKRALRLEVARSITLHRQSSDSALPLVMGTGWAAAVATRSFLPVLLLLSVVQEVILASLRYPSSESLKNR